MKLVGKLIVDTFAKGTKLNCILYQLQQDLFQEVHDLQSISYKLEKKHTDFFVF